jgi:hypothetical protein
VHPVRLVLTIALSALVAALALAGGASAATPKPPSAQTCAAYGASRSLPAITALAPKPGAPRVFAMQFKQQAKNVTTAAAFRTAIECQLRRYVVPNLAKGRPNLVVFNEDLGLMTPGIGSRGKAARKLIADPGAVAKCKGQDLCVTLETLAALGKAYKKPLGWYEHRFGKLNPLSSPLLAATDTQVRWFMGTFSALAKQYGIYLVASGPMAKFRETKDPKAIAALRDPDMGKVTSVYEATKPGVYNTAFVWGPKDVRTSGPAPARNVVQQNDKVPLTTIEIAQGFTPGPATGAAAKKNLQPYSLPGTKAKLGIATSLPAFAFGDLPAGVDPCSDVSKYYMRCLDKLGANLVVQDEANPGQWATSYDVAAGANPWQPLDWMGSGYRNVADPSVHFTYNVTAFMVGSLADLTFDGQSSITQRGLTMGSHPPCHYVGNGTAQPGDVPDAFHPAGDVPQFLALAPWVAPDGPRDQLTAVAKKLAPGSGDRLENDYLETALVADLPFPAIANRPGCATRPAPPRSAGAAAGGRPARRPPGGRRGSRGRPGASGAAAPGSVRRRWRGSRGSR